MARGCAAPERLAAIERLRPQRLSSPAIARQLGLPISTVSEILRRLGLNPRRALDPPVAIVRYQRAHPGELLHLDIKKLGRIQGVGHRITGRRPGAVNRHHGIGWECLHVCIDDACRLAYSEILTSAKRAPPPFSNARWSNRRNRNVSAISQEVDGLALLGG